MREKNHTEQKMRESQSNIKKEGNVVKKKMKGGTPQRRERENGFCVILIEDYHTKVYPSFVIHLI